MIIVVRCTYDGWFIQCIQYTTWINYTWESINWLNFRALFGLFLYFVDKSSSYLFFFVQIRWESLWVKNEWSEKILLTVRGPHTVFRSQYTEIQCGLRLRYLDPGLWTSYCDHFYYVVNRWLIHNLPRWRHYVGSLKSIQNFQITT